MSSVTLPYSINGINGHSSGYSKGTYNFTTTINLYKVQPTYLWFQHADQSADIYVDNVKVTTHWGGYAAFFTDITNYVHVGTNNIKVAVCNTTRNAIAPADGDFNFNATLGKVKVLTSPVLPSVDYGYDGFHVKATNISSSAATLTIRTNVPAGATLICKIDDPTSNYHFRKKKPSTGSEVTFTTIIQNPILWDGTINPHLYNITLEIYKNGDLYHKYERGYGIRYYEYVINDTVKVGTQAEPYTGFLLNGHKYLLRGVCMHHDIEGKANALSDTDIAHDFELIHELGCNFIRLAHYPHPKEVYDWCDKLGIIVQTEGPCVNKFNKCVSDGGSWTDDYYTHLYTQYEDMVRQHFNHPCILFWGLFNEATTDDKTWAKTKLENYKAFIKNIDPERWVGYVVSHSYSDPSDVMGRPDMDWFGCNIYVGWYIDQNSNDPTNQLNKRVKSTITNLSKPLAYSEYGCGGTQLCHSENYMQTTTRGNNPRHDIEYQMWLHEGHIAAIRNFPELLFTGQWQLFDIAVSKRQEGYKVCLDNENVSDNNDLKYLNNKGLIERDHITKKDTFYLYKAEWNPTPFVHICQKNYELVDNRVIKCYSNDGTTHKLYVNNVLVETVSASNNIVTFTARNFNTNDVIKVEGESTYDSFTIHAHNYSQDYLTFNIKSSGDITWKMGSSSATAKTIFYSKNGGSWTDLTSSTSGTSLSVTAGDIVRFKGTNSAYATSYGSTYYNSFGGTATFDVYGNIMSLIGGDNFSNLTSLSSDYTFNYLFYNCYGLLSSENLILPATTLTMDCYAGMFNGCTHLTTAPELPATTMREACYIDMFSRCTSLTTAPELPATTLAKYCYSSMFNGCKSLTTAPELPATTLAYSCYSNMFKNCTNLNYIKCLATDIPASSCTYSWVSGVAAIGTFVKNSNMSSWTTGADGIPVNWIVEDAS